MTERHLLAYAILLLVLIGAFLLWRRSRRVRSASEPHMRIDLLGGEGEDPVKPKPLIPSTGNRDSSIIGTKSIAEAPD